MEFFIFITYFFFRGSSDTNVQIETKYGSIVIDVEAHSLNTVLF